MALTFISGPVRSGKSRYALALARQSTLAVTFVATALRDPGDAPWESRLERHRADRPREWPTIEGAALTNDEFVAIFAKSHRGQCLVVDALGTWLAARIACSIDAFERDVDAFEGEMDREAEALVAAMLGAAAHVIVVCEEVGWDVVPVAASARVFRDVLGRMKQQLAARAERAYLVVCGRALDIKKLGSAIE